MENTYILKSDILRMIGLKINKWSELKGEPQDVTQENFIDNVILALQWVMSDVEQMH